MGVWTLEYGGTEKTLPEWGLADQQVTRQRQNMAVDTVTLRAPGAMEAALQFAYGQPVIIRRDRTGSGPFGSGSIYFRGKAGLPQRSGRGQAEEISYQFYGPWWDFTRLVMQHEWNEFAGWSTPGDPNTDPTFIVKRTSELFLGQGLDGTRMTTGQVISEALSWAASCGVAVQAGTIDPATNFPIYNCRDVTVAEVIVQMCRWTPDVICWFDYSTTPPTFHARKLANLGAVAVAADGNIFATSLVPRYDLQIPAVCIRFKSTNTVDGRPSVVITNQNAPEGATATELGASVHTVELMGSQTNNVYADLECAAADPCQSLTAADRIAWWKKKEPLLSSEYMDALQLSIANVFDEAGAAYTLVYEPYELLSGSVAEWMTVGDDPVVEKKVTIKANATYDLYRVPVRRNGSNQVEVFTNGVWTTNNTAKFLVEKNRRKELSANIRITNAPSGSYDALASFTAGEIVPLNLAADIYNAHQTLQYEGEITWSGEDVPSNIGMGNKLNLTIGSTTYSNLLVQSVSEDVGAGRMTVALGPAAHLGLSDLIELLRVNRYRLVINNPRTRTTGTVSGDGTVQLGKATARENTTTGLGDRETFAVNAVVSGNNQVVKINSTDGELVLEALDNTGALAANVGRILLKLSEALGKEIKLREYEVCVGGVSKLALFLASAPYDPPP